MLRVLILVCCLPSVAVAQIRVATYNIYHRENSDSLPVVLSAIGEESVQGIRRPVDILLLQEIARINSNDAETVAGRLNVIYGPGIYDYGELVGDATNSMRLGVVYRSDVLLELVGEKAIGEISTEGQPRQALRHEFEWKGLDRKFYVYNSHYRAGDNNAGEADREIEAKAIREDADTDLPGGVPIIYAGDFNFYSADDPAYRHLLNLDGNSDGDGKAIDPLSGDWSSLTTHTHSNSKMDGRFDFQLVSEELVDGQGMDLVSHLTPDDRRVYSYRAFGNDGSHSFEGPIDAGTWAPPGVLDPAGVLGHLALASDHLPLVADYTPAPIGDSNLDDVFDSSDLVTVFQAGQYEDAENVMWLNSH